MHDEEPQLSSMPCEKQIENKSNDQLIQNIRMHACIRHMHPASLSISFPEML